MCIAPFASSDDILQMKVFEKSLIQSSTDLKKQPACMCLQEGVSHNNVNAHTAMMVELQCIIGKTTYKLIYMRRGLSFFTYSFSTR